MEEMVDVVRKGMREDVRVAMGEDVVHEMGEVNREEKNYIQLSLLCFVSE